MNHSVDQSNNMSNVSKFPLRNLFVAEKLTVKPDDFNWILSSNDAVLVQQGSEFDQTLHRLCTQSRREMEMSGRCANGCQMYKCIPGKLGLVVELCAHHSSNHSIRQFHVFRRVCERFSQYRFNFNNLLPTETLLNIEDTDGTVHHVVMTVKTRGLRPLLIPSAAKCLNQELNEPALQVATRMLLLSRCKHFALGFNSLMAGCQVNHLHFEILHSPYESKLAEKTVHRIADALYVMDDWLLPAIVTQMSDFHDFHSFIRQCAYVCAHLRQVNQPFNAVLCRAPALVGSGQPNDRLLITAYIFPRQPVFTVVPSGRLSPTATDMRGIVTVYSAAEFQDISEAKIIRCFRESVAIQPDAFDRLTEQLKNHCTFSG